MKISEINNLFKNSNQHIPGYSNLKHPGKKFEKNVYREVKELFPTYTSDELIPSLFGLLLNIEKARVKDKNSYSSEALLRSFLKWLFGSTFWISKYPIASVFDFRGKIFHSFLIHETKRNNGYSPITGNRMKLF